MEPPALGTANAKCDATMQAHAHQPRKRVHEAIIGLFEAVLSLALVALAVGTLLWAILSVAERHLYNPFL